ncbi:P-loop containing nucleoside triphosphate hydrolase protein [Powellomyces hirtus]|nr:P-loop containing nucleoside triphosphate hydrolase protein [Powellomyces hirtus]
MDRVPGHLRTAIKAKSDAKRIKILSLGDPAVGKSCLIKRYCEGRYVPEYISTIGIDYGVKGCVVGGDEVKVNFWDIGGSEYYKAIRTEFYKDTHGVLLVVDASQDVESIQGAVDRWLDELKAFVDPIPLVFVVGTKTDLRTGGVARELGEMLGFRYFETSAVTGEGVSQLFDALFDEVLTRLKVPE